MSHTSKTILIIIMVAVLGLSFMPTLALAQDPYGLEGTRSAAKLPEQKSLQDIIGFIIFAVLGLIGVIFLIYAIIGGFLWLTAGGNPEQVKQGAAHLKNGAIGVMIILSAYALTFFVINNILKATSV